MERRNLLQWIVRGIGATVFAVVSVPTVIKALTPVLESDGEKEVWRPVGPVSEFSVGSMKKAVVQLPEKPVSSSIDNKAVYVWRRAENTFVVYSRSCTDLGCPVTWEPGSEWFYCPCHGGIFDKEGERRAGPPKRALWRYVNRVRNGVLEIDLRSVPAMA